MQRILMVSHPQMSLANVTFSCGFKDYNYFIAVFKRVVGLPPKQYLREVLLNQ